MSEKKRISQQDLLKTKQVKDLFIANPSVYRNFLASLSLILAGDENYSASGALITATFVGFEQLGLSDDDALALVTKGLNDLEVEVS